MPRRQFIADLQSATLGPLPSGITNLQSGEDDGQFEFIYDDTNEGPVKITANIIDVADYPSAHIYMIYCSDDAPRYLCEKLENLLNTNSKTVSELVELISHRLSRHEDSQISSVSEDELMEDDESEDDFDNDEFITGRPSPRKQLDGKHQHTNSLTATSIDWRNRVRSDLRAVKEAGFHVRGTPDLLHGAGAYVTTAIRLGKLGLSEEAMRAWQVDASHYLMLIIYYPNGYKTNEQLQQLATGRTSTSYSVQVVTSETHSPQEEDIIDIFQALLQGHKKNGEDAEICSSLRSCFISKPLRVVLEEQLLPILRFRSSGLDWLNAENMYHEAQDNNAEQLNKIIPPERLNLVLPAVVNADHYADKPLQHHSFPLLATQCTLRHFVRCVEFCLVCHRHIDSEIEAIKPYVCERPLCLYQYMAMGFGPSIEHEIQTQPYVVDLLISFCYASATAFKLEDLPNGIGLVVPRMSSKADETLPPSHESQDNIALSRSVVDEHLVDIDLERSELRLDDIALTGKVCPVKRGSWIVLTNIAEPWNHEELHCKVADTSFYPRVSIDPPIRITREKNCSSQAYEPKPRKAAITPAQTPRLMTRSMIKYDQDFDTMKTASKQLAIRRLCEILPSVSEMQTYLSKKTSPSLSQWTERIPQAAISLLRWIIASNRACIMQVDSTKQDQECLGGMPGWKQFRFAMGAPDKEERFLKAVKATTTRLKLTYPTIFAWHGSPIHNWHAIIREGLHFKRTDHGRAYGDGVYHARDAQTSMSYCHAYTVDQASVSSWPNSSLKISMALALNELVNVPREYVSQTPFYVVQHLDWIQTRYLLVKCASDNGIATGDVKPRATHPQDPKATPTSDRGLIVIPASAIKSRRVVSFSKSASQRAKKKLKGSDGNPIVIDSDSVYESDESDEADLDLLVDEIADHSQTVPVVHKQQTTDSLTDFIPGQLDYSTLPLMPMPTYATSTTTKRLMSDLRSADKVLNMSEACELGWYIDSHRIENVYQWIVELHSFHKFEIKGKPLPLSVDMKKRMIKSVVLEIRFGSDYPFSPPYIRVVRPRFLTFNQGGGGHVVMGGAMCMELLTNTGWSSISSMESVLLQVRLAIASEPFARLDPNAHGDYNTAEAADGYIRACNTHGWTIPPGFHQIAHGMGAKASESH